MYTPPLSATARRICLGALAALAACADQVASPTQPAGGAASGAPATIDPFRSRTGTEQFTITRRTETFERRDGQLRLKDRRDRTARLAHGASSARSDRPKPSTTARSADAEPDAIGALPLAGLTRPARRGATLGDQPYRSRHALEGVPGVEVEREGVGDAPATTLRYFENGVLARTVTQAYRYRLGRWELVRRETRSADGTFHDVIQVDGPAAGDAAAVFPFRPGAGDPGDAGALTSFGTGVLLDGDCDPCKALRLAQEAAYEALMWQEGAALIVCLFTPPPADVLACVAAGLKVAEAYSKFNKADKAYDDCMRNPPRCPEPDFDPTAGAGGGGGGGGGSTGPGGGGGGGGGVTTCYYDVWYDPDTGEVYSSQLLYCI